MSYLFALLLVALPSRLRTRFARSVLHWDIHPTAAIGRSIIRVRHVRMGPGAWIGPRNMIRGLDELVLEEGASIGGRNSIGAVPLGSTIYTHCPDRRPALILGRYSGITTGHEIDCSDRVQLADYAAITGFGTQVLSHRLDLARDTVAVSPVEIGERSFVMTGCILLSGTRLPAYSILSAGSVIITPLTQDYTLYRGNPATAVRALPKNLKLFKRQGTQAQLTFEPDLVD